MLSGGPCDRLHGDHCVGRDLFGDRVVDLQAAARSVTSASRASGRSWPDADSVGVCVIGRRAGKLPQELPRLRRYGLIIVDEVGYLPFEQDAANLFFKLVSSLRTRLADPHQQPALPRLARGLRRPIRRCRDYRPDPPRLRAHLEGCQLPAPRTRHRQPPQHPHYHRQRDLDCPQPLTFQVMSLPEETR
jgi:hypothetical protein